MASIYLHASSTELWVRRDEKLNEDNLIILHHHWNSTKLNLRDWTMQFGSIEYWLNSEVNVSTTKWIVSTFLSSPVDVLQNKQQVRTFFWDWKISKWLLFSRIQLSWNEFKRAKCWTIFRLEEFESVFIYCKMNANVLKQIIKTRHLLNFFISSQCTMLFFRNEMQEAKSYTWKTMQ